MARKIKTLAVVFLTLAVILTAAVSALAWETQPIDGNSAYNAYGDDTTLNTIQEGSKLGGYEDVAAEGPLLTAALLVNFLLTMLGALAIALTVYAGYLWLMSRGNEEDIKKAKDILAGSAVGLLLILASYSITSYIFRSFVDITNF